MRPRAAALLVLACAAVGIVGGVVLHELVTEESSLEEIFLKLTSEPAA